MSVLPEIDLEFTERATGCGQKVKNRSLLRNCGVKLVVQCNTTPNAHPEVMSKWAEKIQVSE